MKIILNSRQSVHELNGLQKCCKCDNLCYECINCCYGFNDKEEEKEKQFMTFLNFIVRNLFVFTCLIYFLIVVRISNTTVYGNHIGFLETTGIILLNIAFLVTIVKFVNFLSDKNII